MKPVRHCVQNPDGTLQWFTAVPFMTVDQAREHGAAKIADPNFIREQIAQASAVNQGGSDNADG